MYNGELINDFCILGDTTKLVERAQINICRLYEAAQDIIVPRGFKLLSAVANVKELILTDDFLKDLAAGDELFDTLPMFCNLSDLSVEWSFDPVSFRIFSMILRRSPRLRSLSFSEEFDSFPQNERDGLLDPVPSCFVMEQISLRIDNTDRGFEDQLFVIGLLLKTACVLEELEVRYMQDFMDASFLEDSIGNLPVGSESCQNWFIDTSFK
ncbi:hypothetical protein DM860_000589 [Cuscuta australis]|uniref:FBD domain-containing protein n=1 Tax=Cuscuta australis TaxID=267555 RepID=A0A328CWX5_9ASTE|nr:hypothetical protein DM860_000589 [Cuscuta australis]